jgi:hypothetical protein
VQIPFYSPEYHYVDFELFKQYNKISKNCFGDNFKSKLILTFDTEIFGKWTKKQESSYPYVLTAIAEILKNNNASASFCLLMKDDHHMKATPENSIPGVVDHLGLSSIELHGYHHSIKSPNHYDYLWFRKGLDEISNKYGRLPSYLAQPSWVWNDTCAILAASIDELQALRGIQSGPNFYKRLDYWPEFNFMFPYKYFGKIYFPYQYVDWKYYDFFGNNLEYNTVDWHMTAGDITKKAGPCFMETIAHPFRLTSGDVDKNLNDFEISVKNYKKLGFEIISSSKAIEILKRNNDFMSMPDLLLIAQDHQVNLHNFRHSADLPRIQANTNEYVKSLLNGSL